MSTAGGGVVCVADWGEVTAQVWNPKGSQLCGLGRGVALFLVSSSVNRVVRI